MPQGPGHTPERGYFLVLSARGDRWEAFFDGDEPTLGTSDDVRWTGTLDDVLKEAAEAIRAQPAVSRPSCEHCGDPLERNRDGIWVSLRAKGTSIPGWFCRQSDNGHRPSA